MCVNVHKIHNLKNVTIIKILEEGLNNIKEQHLIENYSIDKKDSPANLFYQLNNGRFSNGAYYVIEKDNKYIASAGWNRYDNDTALILVRAYTISEFRTQSLLADLLLPDMLNSCKDYKNIWITCNKYNKAIYNWFYRNSIGKSTTISNKWSDIYKNFEPIGIKTINYTEQYVIQYKK